MRRGALSVLTSGLVLGALACGEPTPTRPSQTPAAAAPQAAPEAQINGLINALFAPRDQGDFFRAFARIKSQIASGRTTDAQASIVAFVQLLLTAKQGGVLQDPNGAKPPTTADALRDLVNSVSQFGGLPPPLPASNAFAGDGAVAVVGPAGGTVVSSSGFGGVGFPPGALPADVIVVVSRLPNPVIVGAGPLPTNLTQYPLFYDFSTVPHVAQFAVPVTVGLCRLEVGEPFAPPTQAIADQLQVAHPDPANPTTIELLPVTTAGFVNCNGVTLASARDESEPRSLAGRAWDLLRDGGSRVLGLLRPSVAYAVHGGLGGKTTSFSPFAIVLPVSIGPAGGTVTSADGNASLTVPPGALAVATGIGIQSLASYPADPRVAPGTVYGLTPSGLQFAQPATLRIKYSPATVPGGSYRAYGLRLATVNGAGRWSADPFTQPSVATTDLTASISHFSTYGLLVATDGVSAGFWSTCRLNASLIPSCWGDNSFVELGDGTSTYHFSPQPVAAAGSFVQLAGRNLHYCAILTSGAADCWGWNGWGQTGIGSIVNNVAIPAAVVGGHSFVKVAPGEQHTCGLTPSQEIYCWGDRQTGELGDGSQSISPTPQPVLVSGNHAFGNVAAGYFASCGITDGADLLCWGFVPGGPGQGVSVPTLVAGGLKWSAISISAFAPDRCGVTLDGSAYCWGDNHKGQLGDPALPAGGTVAPNPVVGGHTFVSIAVGVGTVCGLTVSGNVYCWGDNSLGALGDGSTVASRATPGLVSLPSPALSLTAGQAHMCAETLNGRLYCWGNNSFGSLGIGTSALHFSPTPLLGGLSFSGLASGSPNCGLVGSQAYCWGLNPGNGTSLAGAPVAVSAGTFTAISSGSSTFGTSCGLASGGTAFCWGDNSFGQFGDGTTTPSLTPVPAGSGHVFSQLSVSVNTGIGVHTCGITTPGVALCWGDNVFGELGDGLGGLACTGDCLSTTPVAVAGSQTFIAVGAGGGSTCGLTTGNDVYCWGRIDFSFPATPAPLAGGRKFSAITVGNSFACGIELGTAQAFCWGRLFIGSNLNPVAVAGGLSFVELAAGQAHVCGITTSGQVYCWGDRRRGAIGDGLLFPAFASQPVLVPGISAIAVRAGNNATCALLASGSVACWGDDSEGTLGVDHADRFSNVPVLVP